MISATDTSSSRIMKNIVSVLSIVIIALAASCSKPLSHASELDLAEKLMYSDADSALHILETIEPSDLDADSLRARFIFLKAYGHLKKNRSMVGDSLIYAAHNYYRGKDIVPDIRSGIALAWYRFWVGDTPGAIAMLDSLAGLPDVPDTLMVQTLRTRVLLGASEYQGRPIVQPAKRLYELERDTMRKVEAKYMLLSAYEYAGQTDSALLIVDELIDYARSHCLGDKHFLFEVERAQLLTELGREADSDRLVADIFSKAGPDNGAADMLHFQYAINALNRGDVNRAEHHLAIADSLSLMRTADDDAYFRSYSNLLHALIDFKRTGRIRLTHINSLNNRQNERFNRMKASQWESERGALHQQNRALALKAESEHKTVIILIIGLAALLTLAACSWIITNRRQRERENEERIEALQKMVDEYKSAPASPKSDVTDSATLRNVMLRQLGIIKMVAETPTEQNCEMLRRISSIDGNTNGELVDWDNIFEMIDNIYSGFYARLHSDHGSLLSLKEEQIIVLMVAGFSTKEISVITGQSTATIYVRKTAMRKKLGVPEKEDIVRFLLP